MKLTAFVLFTVAAYGQLTGPTPGYVFGKDGLRPIRGMAGASYLGAALIDEADAVAVAPDGSMAAVAGGGRLELRRGFDGGAASRSVLAEGVDSPLLAWNGASLAAYSASSRKALIWRDAAKAAETVDLAGVDGVKAIALDGDSLYVAATSGLYAAAKGSVTRLADLADPAGLAAANGDVYVADAGANLIVASIQGVAKTFAAVAQPVGLQVSKKRLLVASGQSRSIEILDLATGARTGSLELDFAPTRMERAGSVTLLNQSSAAEPLYVLDARDNLAAYFVPAGQEN